MAAQRHPPNNRRRFADAADEAAYVHSKLLYWLYGRGNALRARRFADRLMTLARAAPTVAKTILGNGWLALAAEAHRDWTRVMQHALREQQLIERLRAMPGDRWLFAKHGPFGPATLATDYNKLAEALSNIGREREALGWLTKSERLCRRNQLPFHGSWLREKIDARLATTGQAVKVARVQRPRKK